jgi:hypothetical protein
MKAAEFVSTVDGVYKNHFCLLINLMQITDTVDTYKDGQTKEIKEIGNFKVTDMLSQRNVDEWKQGSDKTGDWMLIFLFPFS